MSEKDNKLHDSNLNGNHDGGGGVQGSRSGGRSGRGRGTCGHYQGYLKGTQNIPTFEASWEECIDDFDEMDLKPDLINGILSYGYQHPVEFQSLAIKPILLGRNVIVQAQPWIGKKTAITIGILQRIFKLKQSQTVLC